MPPPERSTHFGSIDDFEDAKQIRKFSVFSDRAHKKERRSPGTMRAVVLFSRDAESTYQQLLASHKKREQSIARAISRVVETLKEEPHLGDPIAKRLFPKKYQTQHGISNLFRVELPDFWRTLYTLVNRDGTLAVFVIDIISHQTYDWLFGYQK